MKKLLVLTSLVFSVAALAESPAPAPINSVIPASIAEQPILNLQQSVKDLPEKPKLHVCLYADLAYSEGAVLYTENGGTSYKCMANQDLMSWQEIKK